MAKPLESSALSAFCESVALMLSAGIQTDEAVHMMAENMEDTPFKRVCLDIYGRLIKGSRLSQAMVATGCFPAYAVDMVAVGEKTGRLEAVLHSLGVYYDEEDRLFAKIRSSVAYPAALLCVMSVILAFTVIFILPVFGEVYGSLAGSLTAGSFNIVNASMVIGWVALAVVLVFTVLALICFCLSRTPNGRNTLMGLFEKIPLTRPAMYQLALSRFTTAVAICTASGVNTDDAMRDALETVTHPVLRSKVQEAYRGMIDAANPRSLAQVITEYRVFEPVYARMLTIGTRSGSLDAVLERLAASFFDDAMERLDRVIDAIEPALAAFLTVAVGATLISVMLPLVGVMGSIG